MRVYISGAITGTNDYMERFQKAENNLKKQGYSVINPARLNSVMGDDAEYIASEIVKQGGVSDDVCEWKQTKEIMDNAEFKVGCNPNALKRGVVPNNFSYHDFKYCPYCGKKIKAVE